MSDKKEKKSKDTKKEKSEGKEKCKDKSQKRKYEEIEEQEKACDEVKEAKGTKKEKSVGKEKCKDKSQKRKYEEIEEKQEKACDEVKEAKGTKKEKSEGKCKDKSQKRKYEEIEEEQEKGCEVKDKIQKKKQEEPKEEHVSHSANDWEHADLGDDSRKNKFLRLMGANREHKGKEHIGAKNSHGRSKEETEKVSEDLEEQYQQGLDMKLSGQARRHVGLGFHEAEKGCRGGYTAFVPASKSSKDESDVPKDVDKPKAGEKKFGLFVKASK